MQNTFNEIWFIILQNTVYINVINFLKVSFLIQHMYMKCIWIIQKFSLSKCQKDMMELILIQIEGQKKVRKCKTVCANLGSCCSGTDAFALNIYCYLKLWRSLIRSWMKTSELSTYKTSFTSVLNLFWELVFAGQISLARKSVILGCLCFFWKKFCLIMDEVLNWENFVWLRMMYTCCKILSTKDFQLINLRAESES